MRIVLLYPPPWAFSGRANGKVPTEMGPPKGWTTAQRFNGDEVTIPQGLMSIAAQAKCAGNRVTLLNLYAFSWEDISEIIAHVPAELYGLSCLTINRRGTWALSELIRKLHPFAFIVVGNSHVSALPREILRHWQAVDAVVIGEGEKTFLKIVSALKHHRPVAGIAGTVCRDGGTEKKGPDRERIRDLDTLASPYNDYKSSMLLTSRGCTHRCTYCGSPAMWRGKVRFHSVDYILEALDRIVNVYGEKAVAIKDDTFTCNRRMAMEICRRLASERFNFIWSCDTRADTLDEGLLFAMRSTGCQRISLGVESASSEILGNIKKQLSPQKVLDATRMAKKFGLQVRYYMMAGNRGETAETLGASIAFLHKAQPSQIVFSFLSLYPGTEEFCLAVDDGIVSPDIFFESDLPVIKYFRKKNGGPELLKQVEWVLDHTRVQRFWRYSVTCREEILKRLRDLPGAYLDLGMAYLDAGHLSKAETLVHRALDLDYPLPGLAYNVLACIAAIRNDGDAAALNLDIARQQGVHRVVEQNLKTFQQWKKEKQWRYGLPLELKVHHGFERSGFMRQPAHPGPIRLQEVSANPSSPPKVFLPNCTE